MVDAQVTLAIVTGLLPAAWLFWTSTKTPTASWKLLRCLPLLLIYYAACLFLETTTLPASSWKLLHCLALAIYYSLCLFFGIHCAACLLFALYCAV